MRGLASAVVFSALVGIGFVSIGSAQPNQPDVLPREFECMAKSFLGGSKVVTSMTKCVSKCFDSLWDGEVPESDCLPPYANRTAECTTSVATKVSYVVLNACTTGPGADCPECYTPSGCGSEQADAVPMLFGGLFDILVPDLFCERDGALPTERKCQLNAAKWVARHHLSVARCYRKCFVDARSGGDVNTCMPPATAPGLLACLEAARTKTGANIDKYCDETRYPDAAPECSSPYPSGAEWASRVESISDPLIPVFYCGS
jgi:hypothetical protein